MNMKLISFVKALVPRLSKEQVLEDIRITAGELDQIVAPCYKHAADYFKSNKFNSEACKSLSDSFYTKLDKSGIARQSNMVAEVALRVDFLKDNLSYVSAQIEELMERDIINEGLTAKKALLMRAAEHISFLSRFSSDLLSYVYTHESESYGTEVNPDLQLVPAVKKHVEANIGFFASYLGDYGMPNKEFSKIITQVPDVVISSRNENAILGTYKENEIDPFKGIYLSGFTGNPIYHVRLFIAEWQTARYKAAKEKKKTLELRLMHLRLVNEKKNDARLEAEIAYNQNRVDKLERYLREVEEDLELANG